jgi:glycosyltransferase involved in cell wall biosynthesis
LDRLRLSPFNKGQAKRFMKAAAVDYIAQTHQHNSEDEANSRAYGLPLVSVVIVNYNYGRFLKQAADSVFEQTYPNIECIIVDNASTDESADVLLAISKQYPSTTILRRSDNGGQSLATIEGFEASSGEYVVFLDADDVLLPTFLATHIFVHLSLRIPVGFTSADMIQSVDSRMVLGTIYGLSEYVRSGRGVKPGLVRRIDESAPEVWPLRSPDGGLESQVHLVQPGDVGIWVWAPTSGNCFRRDALQLFLMKESLRELRSCTDAYLTRGISVLMGSALIDRSLGIYRLHGMNVFSKHPNLYCMLHYERGGPSDNDLLGRKLVIDHLIANARLFLRKSHSSQHYIQALTALDSAWPRIPSTVGGCRSYLAGKLVSESAILARELGLFSFVRLLIRLKVSPKVILLACLRRKANNECEPQPAASMEIICLDNGLISKGEHNYKLATKLAEVLARRKLRYRMFGAQAMDQSIAEELGAKPHFRRSLYDGVGLSRGEERLRSAAAFFSGTRAEDPIRSEHKTWAALNEAFEEDLAKLPTDVWKSANLVVVPAISQNQILGLIRYLLRQPQERLPRVVCQLMFPPSWTSWGQVAVHGKQFYRDAFQLAAPLLDRCLFLTAENTAMHALFEKDFGIRAKILPIPFDGSPRKETGDGTMRLGFFGYSKCDKGFHLLPKAIALCQRQRLAAEFVVQIQHSGWEQRTIEAERALRALEGVQFVEGVLTGAEYAAWTSQIDVMLLPYDPVAFGAARGSGIFTESVAAGRPVIASRGTFAGASIENNEAEGEVFTPYTSEGLADAIARLIPNLPACKARAAERTEAFARHHNADTYVDVLLMHARSQH